MSFSSILVNNVGLACLKRFSQWVMAIQLKLYLLELADDMYYVGQTDEPDFRFSEHLSGKGAKWTRNASGGWRARTAYFRKNVF